MDITKSLIFYNSINIDFQVIKNFYNIFKNTSIKPCFKPVDITNRSEISLFKSNIKKMIKEEEKILIINIGGDGSLFSGLSIAAEFIPKIYTISFNFGTRGFYCFYSKEMLYSFIDNKFDLIQKIEEDYNNQNYTEGYFWKANDQYIFIADLVIKSYVNYKALRLSYIVNDVEIEELCDGIVVFTPFGATGYFLSINGIYIDIEFQDLIGISFISPHSIKYKPQILKDKTIKIINKDKKPSVVVTDGQEKIILDPNQSISVQKSNQKFILLGEKQTLKKWLKNFYV